MEELIIVKKEEIKEEIKKEVKDVIKEEVKKPVFIFNDITGNPVNKGDLIVISGGANYRDINFGIVLYKYKTDIVTCHLFTKDHISALKNNINKLKADTNCHSVNINTKTVIKVPPKLLENTFPFIVEYVQFKANQLCV